MNENKCDVFQAITHRGDRDASFDLAMGVTPEKVLELLKTGRVRYSLVAQVANCGSLDHAFERTNTIDTPWWKNSDVTRFFSGEGCRSTSVGDIVRKSCVDTNFLVASCGFRSFDFDIALHAAVFEALDNAKDNGYDYTDTPDSGLEAITIDLMDGASDLEGLEVTVVQEHVKDWVKFQSYTPK